MYLRINKFTQRSFAAHAGIDEAKMSRLLNSPSIPNVKTIRIIEKATNGQVTWIDLIAPRVSNDK